TKIYDCSKTKITPAIFINAESHPVDKDGNSLLPLTLPDLKKQAATVGVGLETGEATVKAKVRRALVERSEAFVFKETNIPVGKNDSQTLWTQILKHLPMCALFVSDRSSTEKDREAQTPMGVAVEAALSEVQADLDRLSEHVEKRVQDVADRTLAKLNDMNAELASQLTASLKDKPKWKDIFKYTLNSDEGVPMDKRGSGVRRLVLLNFFRAEAERKANSEGHRPIIYAIEEPETSQHPDHQKMLMRALLEISRTGGQVLITTHAPGLAGEVPVENLRFIDCDKKGIRIVRSSKTEDPLALFTSLAERLGMLPDNNVRVLVCVEGKNDVRFLSHVSHTIHLAYPSLPDLSSDPRFVLIPMNGANLRDIVNLHLFKNFRKPEFHIYDRDEGGTYAAQEAEVNARGDGSMALQTRKRYMESYIHPAAIARVKQVDVEVGDEDDYISRLGSVLGVKKQEAKAILADEVAPAMTMEEIDERDGNREIRGWLSKLAEMANR
ncbi:MAG: ATP-binding protein, partial [Deltaproteobacteria bacterium]|nr:ATP-binding protein [Deltaproteobacteria bacterium]